ncbi:MAG: CapA family protein [Candidatus Lokiarchaeota archaeon]|nr:CapA family protein [Candidatus Lokiarchaeota archaeon]
MKISFIGDLALNGLIVEKKELNHSRFKEVSKLLKTMDLNISNLETPIIVHGNINPTKKLNGVILGTEKNILMDILKYININCVSIANNHIFDYSDNGIEETLQCLNSLKIKWNGIREKGTKNICTIVKKNNLRIGFLAYVDLSTNPKILSDSKYELNVLNVKNVIQDIRESRHDCDLLIVSLHWGKDYSNYFTKEQRKIAHRLINAGADLIMGHHPHVVQAYENYRGKRIFYSLGNLCHGDYYKEDKIKALRIKTKISIIALLNIESNKVDFIVTKEKKGNFIKVQPNIVWKNYYRLTLLKNQYKFIHCLLVIKESIFDRFYDFLFGYYRKPITEIMNIKNLKKIKYINEDINSLK